MITHPTLLRPFLERWPLLFDQSELIGIHTYKAGYGEGVFYRLKSGDVYTGDGVKLPEDGGLYRP